MKRQLRYDSRSALSFLLLFSVMTISYHPCPSGASGLYEAMAPTPSSSYPEPASRQRTGRMNKT